MRQLAPGKTLIEAPTAGNSATCKSCAHCPWMAMNALQGVVDCLETRQRRDPGARADAHAARWAASSACSISSSAHPASIAQPRRASCRTSARPEHEVRPQRDPGTGARAQHPRRAARRPRHAATGPACWCPQARAHAARRCVVREDAVLCGRDWFDGVMLALDPQARVDWQFAEGARHAGRQHRLPHRGRWPRAAVGRAAGAELPAAAQRHRHA